MGKRIAKATKRLAKSGELKRTIDARRKHQKVRKDIERRKAVPKGKKRSDAADDEMDDVNPKGNRNDKTRAMDFLGDEESDGEADDFSASKKGEK